MPIKLDGLWAGTESSLQDLRERLAAVTPEVYASVEAKRTTACGGPGSDCTPTSRLVQRVGTTGIVHIRGVLVNSDDDWWNEWIGAVGYGEIRQAVLELASDPEITSILLDISSGGGQVSGMSDAASFISRVDKEFKPVFSHTSGSMCSAAYYLGCCARSISAATLAEVGSIGVLIVQTSLNRARQELGVDDTVIRAGEFKALGIQYEPLSDKAREVLQKSCDYTYELFLQHVSRQRGVPASYAKEPMGEGRVYIGQQAADIGLVDTIATLDQALQGAVVAKTFDNPQHGLSASTQQEQQMAHKLTPMYAAARQAALQTTEQPPAEGAPTETTAAQTAATSGEQAAEQTDGLQTAQGGAETSAEPDTHAAETIELRAQVKLLTQQAADLGEQMVKQRADNLRLTEEVQSAAQQREGLRTIASAVVDHMSIALNLPSGRAASMSDSQLMAEYERLTKDFDSKFKAGGVSVPSSTTQAATPSPVQSATLKAARLK